MPTIRRRTAVLSALAAASVSSAQKKANTFAIVGDSGVSAQQMFLGTPTKVYFVDKVQNNPLQVAGHPVWASEYDLETNAIRALPIKTNSFCAGGVQLGNGSWVNVGGNQAVTTLGVATDDVGITDPATGGAYQDTDGGRSTRVFTPCSDESCYWTETPLGEVQNRWYPSLEALPTGEAIVLGGELNGGYTNYVNQHQNNPTFEFFPSRGAPQPSAFLDRTQPNNLYPITFLLPDGQLFMQANWQTQLLNPTTYAETPLPNVTHAQRTYPASGSTLMLPLTKANNWQPTIWMAGGMTPEREDWDVKKWAVIETAASQSVVRINPLDANPTYVDDEDLPEGRTMGQAVILPNEMIFLCNGAGMGTAGYGDDSWAAGQSYADKPVLRPAYYNHTAPLGSRWITTGLPSSTVPRMYHSSASLLPDGSVIIAGSSPSADVITEANNATYPFKTEYRIEMFYPDYYDSARPAPTGIPDTISYGGAFFNLALPAASVGRANLDTAVKVVVMRTGFVTHAMSMGQRFVQLNHTSTANADGTGTLHVGQLTPNPALLAPGPAWLFVVVDGVPSIGSQVMIGNGKLGTQPLGAESVLPASSKATTKAPATTTTAKAPAGSRAATSAASDEPASTETAAVQAAGAGTKSVQALAVLAGLVAFFL